MSSKIKRPKITLLGAGSGFTQKLFTDILLIEDLKEGTIGLVDIDKKRLEVNVRLMRRLLGVLGKENDWTVEWSTERKDVLPGTDYLINTIEVAGTRTVKWDYEVPLKYGIDQCIGDTIGPGGIMKALRTLPSWLEIVRDAEELCPGALIMNYTNPMSIMSLATLRFTDMPFVGLCHSVQNTLRDIASYVGVPAEEIRYRCGGINHMAWYVELRWKGEDLYPRLRKAMADPEIYEKDPVRFEVMKEFGYFVTESSGHFSEYVPFFRKRKDLLEKYCRDGYRGGSGFYAYSWPGWRRDVDKKRRDMAAGRAEIPLERSLEYASEIVEGHFFNRPKVINASVMNTGLIPNLPWDGVVEVPVLVDGNGYTPTYFGELPEQCAAMCRSNMAVFNLCVEGILKEDREAIIHAMMLDPLSSAVCSPAEIREMAEELFRLQRNYIPAWCRKKRTVSAQRKG